MSRHALKTGRHQSKMCRESDRRSCVGSCIVSVARGETLICSLRWVKGSVPSPQLKHTQEKNCKELISKSDCLLSAVWKLVHVASRVYGDVSSCILLHHDLDQSSRFQCLCLSCLRLVVCLWAYWSTSSRRPSVLQPQLVWRVCFSIIQSTWSLFVF